MSVNVPQLDLPRLGTWLDHNVASFDGLRQATRIVGGNSNPIWRLETNSGSYILRTQPSGTLLKSAHALDREVRVIRALSDSGVPVAHVQAYCEDPGIIGVQFYVMDFVAGDVHRDLRLPDVPPGRRRAIYHAAIDMLARINMVDIDRSSLRSFGRPGHYFRRQLHRWTEQYKASLPEGDKATDQLIHALESLMPDSDESPVLLHGDSRLDNLMFAPGTEQIVAVLDWELSTLGNPLADLGQFLAVQELPSDYQMPGLKHIDRSKEGIPTASEQASRYFAATGRPPCDMRFYQGFAMFRQAAMSAGLKRRAALGTAVNETALLFGNTMSVFAQTGLEILEGQREI